MANCVLGRSGNFLSKLQRAKELAPLGANRETYGGQKERLFGENAALNSPHGAAHMLKNSDLYRH